MISVIGSDGYVIVMPNDEENEESEISTLLPSRWAMRVSFDNILDQL